MKNKYLPAVRIIKTENQFRSFCVAIPFQNQHYIVGYNCKKERTNTALTEKQYLN